MEQNQQLIERIESINKRLLNLESCFENIKTDFWTIVISLLIIFLISLLFSIGYKIGYFKGIESFHQNIKI